MGCGCGGGGAKRQAAAPKLPLAMGQVTGSAGNLHPNVAQMQNVLKLADERRKVEMLKREQMLRALKRP